MGRSCRCSDDDWGDSGNCGDDIDIDNDIDNDNDNHHNNDVDDNMGTTDVLASTQTALRRVRFAAPVEARMSPVSLLFF